MIDLIKPAYQTGLGNPMAKHVFVLLIHEVNSRGYGWPSMQYIANYTEVNLRTVQRFIQVFAMIGLLTKVKSPHDGFAVQIDLSKLGKDLSGDFKTAYADTQSRPVGDGSEECPRGAENVVPTHTSVVPTHTSVVPTQIGVVPTFPPHPLIGGPVIDPLGTRYAKARPVPPAKETLRPVNPDAGGEMMASVWLFEELGVPSDFGMRDLAAQAIRMQAREWGGIETAAERILMAAKDAKAGGETRWRFWLTDQGYLRKQNGETRNQGQSRGETNGTYRPSVTKQRVDRNRTAVFETAIKRGWISVDDLDGKLGEAVPEPGDEGVDGRIRGGFRAAGPEILPPEIHGSRGGAADQVRSGILSPA